MNDLIKQKIIASIQSSQSEEQLANYFYRVAEKLRKPKFQDETKTMKEAMLSILENKAPRLSIKLSSPVFSKLSDFFWLTSGLHIIAAPSGHGKTFWATEWAKEAAKKGAQVLFVSLEMSADDLAARSLAELTSVPLSQVIQNEFTDVQRGVIRELLEEGQQDYFKNIHIESVGDYDWNKIYPKLWDRMIKLQPKLIIVDYAQMIFDSEERDSRMSQMLSDIARQLKLFADKTDSAVLLLSQMNREALKESKNTKKWEDFGSVPLSHEHVKESGGIVEAADSVQIVCVPARFHECPESFIKTFQVTVDKSRRIGKLKTVLFPFNSDQMKFL